MQVLADDHADVVEDGGQAGLGEGQGAHESEQAQDELACTYENARLMSAQPSLSCAQPVGQPDVSSMTCLSKVAPEPENASCIAKITRPAHLWA